MPGFGVGLLGQLVGSAELQLRKPADLLRTLLARGQHVLDEPLEDREQRLYGGK